MSLAAAAAAAAAVSDLAFVKGNLQSNCSTRVFKIFKVDNWIKERWFFADGNEATGMSLNVLHILRR